MSLQGACINLPMDLKEYGPSMMYGNIYIYIVRCIHGMKWMLFEKSKKVKKKKGGCGALLHCAPDWVV